MEPTSSMVYVAFDADDAGKKIGRAILSDSPDELKHASDRIILGNEIISRWAERHQGKDFSSGGDQGVWYVPVEATAELDSVRSDYQFATGLTVSMGIGRTLSESGKSLLVAKFRGKNMVISYAPEIEDEIRQVSAKLDQGTGSTEEKKLGEAYLKPEGYEAVEQKSEEHDDCPYCVDMQEEETCPYCEEMDAPGESSGMDDCPYCRDMDHEEDCPYCKDMDDSQRGTEEMDNDVVPTEGPTVTEPSAQSAEAYEEKGLNPPTLDKPMPGDTPPQEVASPAIADSDNQADTPSNRALDIKDGNIVEDSQPQVAPEEIGETPAAILAQLDQDGGDAPTPEDEQAVANIDDTDMVMDDNAEENVSRPDDYDENIPGDMGLGEEEQEEGPDLSGVLQEGLDDHANNAQREKVVQMAAEALQGFKGCKQILEKAKDQAPQLYQSTLSMLRAMIEMAKLLGLDEATEETAEEVVGEGQEEAMPQEEQPMGDEQPVGDESEETHDWKQPFKQHPEHGGATAEGGVAEEDPKAQRR
jgi:hypothetical protein